MQVRLVPLAVVFALAGGFTANGAAQGTTGWHCPKCQKHHRTKTSTSAYWARASDSSSSSNSHTSSDRRSSSSSMSDSERSSVSRSQSQSSSMTRRAGGSDRDEARARVQRLAADLQAAVDAERDEEKVFRLAQGLARACEWTSPSPERLAPLAADLLAAMAEAKLDRPARVRLAEDLWRAINAPLLTKLDQMRVRTRLHQALGQAQADPERVHRVLDTLFP